MGREIKGEGFGVRDDIEVVRVREIRIEMGMKGVEVREMGG